MEILAQSSADFALSLHTIFRALILGASRGHLSDSVIFLFLIWPTPNISPLSAAVVVSAA